MKHKFVLGRGEIVRKSLLFAAVLLAITALSGRAQASGHIYLLRGLAGIFSTGLDVLDEKLLQRGYIVTIHPYDFYNSLAEEAARLQKSGKGPIIIMGHSLGADAAIYMAEKMKKLGAPVALVVAFGPTTNLVAPSNVGSSITTRATLWYQKGLGSKVPFPTSTSVPPPTSII
jgi:pimeloyl-ACP methyl ester carboxylesterase